MNASAAELHALYRRRALSPVEALEAVLARIAAQQPLHNAFRLLDADAARVQARAAEARWMRGAALGPIDGIPVTVKDLLPVRGWPTRMGSLATTAEPATADAPSVARLRSAGAVLLGKTQTSEFGARGVTESALAGITRNPWDPARTPLGSSGGAAVAAALGCGPLHLATDGGGSIRAPAAACGVFGFKPSLGLVPVAPPAHTRTLFHIGPITRTVADACLLLDGVAPAKADSWAVASAGGVAGLRVAAVRSFEGLPVDGELAAGFEAALRVLRELGAIVEDCEPELDAHRSLFLRFWEAGAARLLRGMAPHRHGLVDPQLRAFTQRGMKLTLPEWHALLQQRRRLRLQAARLHERYALLACPVLAAPPPLLGQAAPPAFCALCNLTGQPAASVPCGFTRSGLPMAFQLVAARGRDELVMRAAAAFAAARPWHLPLG